MYRPWSTVTVCSESRCNCRISVSVLFLIVLYITIIVDIDVNLGARGMCLPIILLWRHILFYWPPIKVFDTFYRLNFSFSVC